MIDTDEIIAELLWTNLTLEEALEIVLNRPIFSAVDELGIDELCLIHTQVFACDACLRWHRTSDSILDEDLGSLCVRCAVRFTLMRHGRRAIQHAGRIAALGPHASSALA